MARKRGGKRQDGGKPKPAHKTRRPQRNLIQGDLEEHANRVATQLSLLDVARNTERRRDGERHNQDGTGLVFVHGGLLEGSFELKPTSTRPAPGPASQVVVAIDHKTHHRAHDSNRTQTHSSPIHATHNSGEQLGDSEDEVIVFRGRSGPPNHRPAEQTSNQVNATKGIIDKTTVQFNGSGTDQQRQECSEPNHGDPRTSDIEQKVEDAVSETHITRTSSNGSTREVEDNGPGTSEDEEALQDYIANLLAQESSTESDDQQGEGPYERGSPERIEYLQLKQHALTPSRARARKRARHDERGFDGEGDSTSPETDVSMAASVDTVDQATRDLQVAFDDPEDHKTSAVRKITTSRCQRPAGSSRYDADRVASAAPPSNSRRKTGLAGTDVEHSEILDIELTSEVSSGRWTKHRSGVASDLNSTSSLAHGERNEFDLTDRSRISIGDHNRSTVPKFGLDISDSEMERHLLESWGRDKAKKRQRKLEREAARAVMLARTRLDDSATDTGELQGLGWDAITAQLKVFLLSNDESLTLAPMPKRTRRVVHEFANKFNLKSKSAGNGKNRFPTLVKTPRTIRVSGALFEEVESRLARRFTTGPKKQFRDMPVGKDARYGKSSFAAASYKDGEVVGAAAPEIGLENRGRAMLEKMGWSSGTALGAENNKGILLPVTHTVKNSRLGLG